MDKLASRSPVVTPGAPADQSPEQQECALPPNCLANLGLANSQLTPAGRDDIAHLFGGETPRVSFVQDSETTTPAVFAVAPHGYGPELTSLAMMLQAEHLHSKAAQLMAAAAASVHATPQQAQEAVNLCIEMATHPLAQLDADTLEGVCAQASAHKMYGASMADTPVAASPQRIALHCKRIVGEAIAQKTLAFHTPLGAPRAAYDLAKVLIGAFKLGDYESATTLFGVLTSMSKASHNHAGALSVDHRQQVGQILSQASATMWTEAAAGNKPEAIDLLVQLGVDVDSRRASGDTALCTASTGNNPTAIEVLVGNSAKVNVVNNAGQSPLMLASEKGSVEVAEVLIRCNASVNQTDPLGNTPFTIACDMNRLDVARNLHKTALRQTRKASTGIPR
jgi:hypothetical protein